MMTDYSQRPSNFDHTPSNQAAIDKFLKNDAVRRLTKFVGTKMAFYQPRMTRLYTNTLEKVDTLHTAASKAFRTDLSESSAGGGRVAEANQVVQESWEGQSNQGGNVRAGGGGGGGGGGGYQSALPGRRLRLYVCQCWKTCRWQGQRPAREPWEARSTVDKPRAGCSEAFKWRPQHCRPRKWQTSPCDIACPPRSTKPRHGFLCHHPDRPIRPHEGRTHRPSRG